MPKIGKRVLVTGGRDYTNREVVFDALDEIHKQHGISMIIQGGAGGADCLAFLWATDRKVSDTTCPANWRKYGKAAGPIRNQQMLDDCNPDLVVAFPGGRGTANMVSLAKKANVTIIFVGDDHA